MASSVGSLGTRLGETTARLLVVFEDTSLHLDKITELLAARGYRAERARTPSEVDAALGGKTPPRLVLVVAHDPGATAAESQVVRAAHARGVPLLLILDDLPEPETLAELLNDSDDWVSLGGLATELHARVARVLRRSAGASGGAAPADSAPPAEGGLSFTPQFLSLVIHDLRTPLNVIGLSLRMIEQFVPANDPGLEEDLRVLEENFRQIERMLTQLGDFYRAHDKAVEPCPMPFDPRRLVHELVETRPSRPGHRNSPVVVEVAESCPREVTHDQVQARLALQYALANATAAAMGRPVRVVLRGGGDRWVTEMAVDAPPPPSVTPLRITPLGFERLCGTSAERRGMDAAIAARISERFGGTVRLDVEPGHGTALVLDWPVRAEGA